jgi:DNA-binding MarR family transcriptional regulator
MSVKGRAWRALIVGYGRLSQRLDEALQRETGLELRTYDVLLHVSEGEGGRRMGELAEAVVMSKSGLTALVDRLEGNGLLERRPDPTDRRATRICLTAEGAAAYEAAAARHREIVHELFFEHVTPDEAATMHTALERVLSKLDGADGAIDRKAR